jgi:hypothetical protein
MSHYNSFDSPNENSDGLPKKAELFCFFQIEKPDVFRQKLPAFTDKWVTTVTKQRAERARIKKNEEEHKKQNQQHAKDDVPPTPDVPLALVNIAFSVSGVKKVR